MRKKLFILGLITFAAFGLSSCGGDDNGGSGGGGTGGGSASLPTPSTETYAKKLTASGSNALGIAGIELTEDGKYVVEMDVPVSVSSNDTEKKIYVGSYTVKDKKYLLDNFGTLTITEVGTNVTVNIETPVAEVSMAAKQEASVVSSKTSIDLCRTWTITQTQFSYVEYDANGKAGTPVGARFIGANLEEMANWLYEHHDVDIKEELGAKKAINSIFFTKRGTFTIEFANENSVGEWKWSDEKNGKFSYEWLAGNMGNDFENGEAVVKWNADGTTCTLSLNGDVQKSGSGKTYKVSMIFTLKAANAVK